MNTEDADPTTIPWPHWMLRAVATGDDQAMWDLIWSVGGSPPYGGVPYDEGKAVYDLCENYRGPGMAPEATYARVGEFCGDDVERQNALEAFRSNDQITSNPDTFSAASVAAGSELAERADHDGLRCLFQLYEAQVALRTNDTGRALESTMTALRKSLELASNDEAYSMRVAQAAQNAVSLTHLSGDTEGAQRLREQLSGVMSDSVL